MEPFSGRQSRQTPVQHEPAPIAPRPEVASSPRSEPATRQAVRHDTPRPRRNRQLRFAVMILGALVVLALLAALWQSMHNSGIPGVDAGKYQAVFLRDKYVYIGKLSEYGNGYYKLTSVFYPSSTTTGTDANANENTQLVKLGNDLLGAEDQMMIAKSQVLSYENLKDDGQAAKAIQAYLNKK